MTDSLWRAPSPERAPPLPRGAVDEIRAPIVRSSLAILAVWYVAAALMNASLQRDLFANAGRTDYSTQDLIGASLNMERPKLPAPHQVASELYKLVFATPPTSKRSLVYHGAITLEETLIGFVIGSAWASASPCSSSPCAGSSAR